MSGFFLNTLGTAQIQASAVTTAKIADDAVTYAKIQNISATDKILGRSTAGAGDTEEIACTAAGRALLDDAAASNQRTTLGLGDLAILSTITEDLITLASANALVGTSGSAGAAGEVSCIAGGRTVLANSVDITSWTPTVSGSSTPGAGTYSTQVGRYIRIGNVVFFVARMVWSAHTGTGNIQLDLPFTSATVASLEYPVQCAYSALTWGSAGCWANITSASAVAALQTADPLLGGAVAAVAIDSAAQLRVMGIMLV